MKNFVFHDERNIENKFNKIIISILLDRKKIINIEIVKITIFLQQFSIIQILHIQ